MLQEHPFDVLTLLETWLKDDVNLLNYIQIPGYKFSYKNQNERNVSVYISKIQLNTKYAIILTK